MKKFWLIFITVLVIGLCVAMGVLINRQVKNETTATYSSLEWEIGNIQTDDSGNLKGGQKIEDNTAMRTSKMITTEGLEITFKENSEVNVTLFCYDKDGTYLGFKAVSKGDDGKGTYTGDLPEGTEKVKIVIETLDDTTVNFFTSGKYIGQVTIKYNK